MYLNFPKKLLLHMKQHYYKQSKVDPKYENDEMLVPSEVSRNPHKPLAFEYRKDQRLPEIEKSCHRIRNKTKPVHIWENWKYWRKYKYNLPYLESRFWIATSVTHISTQNIESHDMIQITVTKYRTTHKLGTVHKKTNYVASPRYYQI